MAQDSSRGSADFSPAYKRFALAMLTAVYALNFIDRQILVILQEPIKADMGLSDAQLGLLSGFAFAVIYVTAGIPIAYWADRGNRRNIISLAVAVWSGMTAISGLAQNYGQLLLARVGVGLGEAGGSPPAHSMISDYYPPAQRATALSIYSSGIYMGVLLGFLFGGVIAEAFGWRTAFMVVGLPGVLFAVVLRFTLREPPRGRWENPAIAHAPQPRLRQTMALLRDRPSFWYVAMGSAFASYVAYGNGNFLPSFLIRTHGMSIAEVGTVLALVSGVSGALGTFLGGYLSDRYGTRDMRWYLWIPMLGIALAYFPYLNMLLTDNIRSGLALVFFALILNSFYLGPCIALSHALVEPGMRAMTSAILLFVLNMIGLGLGPLLTGMVSDMLAPAYGDQALRYSMLVTTQMYLLALLMFALAAKHLPADLAKR
ncbi:MAG: MFS transporter [Halieaceae bacterium]|jgi:predicted MFS family arabinose efflux permease|nr:MFS transporter [Halieaceae bacterium]